MRKAEQRRLKREWLEDRTKPPKSCLDVPWDPLLLTEDVVIL